MNLKSFLNTHGGITSPKLKLDEVTRVSKEEVAPPPDNSAKEADLQAKAINAYTKALTANKLFHPKATDVSNWLFGGGFETESLEELIIWTNAIGHMVRAKPNDKESEEYEQHFRTFSQYLSIAPEIVDFVLDGGKVV